MTRGRPLPWRRVVNHGLVDPPVAISPTIPFHERLFVQGCHQTGV